MGSNFFMHFLSLLYLPGDVIIPPDFVSSAIGSLGWSIRESSCALIFQYSFWPKITCIDNGCFQLVLFIFMLFICWHWFTISSYQRFKIFIKVFLSTLITLVAEVNLLRKSQTSMSNTSIFLVVVWSIMVILFVPFLVGVMLSSWRRVYEVLEMSDPVSSNTLHNIPLTLMTTMGYITGLFPVSINKFFFRF